MKNGVLIYDNETERYDVRLGLEDYYGGLHCGESFEVKIRGKWQPTRIEKGNDWYLVGFKTALPGLQVRMYN